MNISKCALIISTLICLSCSIVKTKYNFNPPNIIFIFADDWGYGDISAHGSEWIETPHIDQMAREGIDFTNFTVNSPVCSPSRVAVMTGQFPARQCVHQHFAGVRANQNRGMPDWMDAEGISLPRELQKAGYATGHFGKWHLGAALGVPKEDAYGYDEYATFNGSKTIAVPKAGSVDVDLAEAFINKHKNESFFINLWLHEAHTAHYPEERFMKKFSHLEEQKQVYASIIAEGDEAVGRIMSLLKELKIDKNTLVVFSTDNGPEWEGSITEKIHRTNDPKGLGKYYSVGETGGLKGQKRSLFAGGIRVPFIVRWPGVTPKGKHDKTTVATAVDLLPTFLEAADVPLPDDYESDGESILSAIKGDSFNRTKPIFWQWLGGQNQAYTWPTQGVRAGDWKLVVDLEGQKNELYNLVSDWVEQKNVAAQYPDKVDELTTLLIDWKKSLPTEPRVNCLSPNRKRNK